MTLTFHRHTLLAGSMALSAGLSALAGDNTLASDGPTVAVVEQVRGDVLLERRGQQKRLAAGRQLLRHDRLVTGRDARTAVAFKDGSRLILGEHGDLTIEDWRPEQGRNAGALLLDLVSGPVRLTAARPLKAPDKRVELRTPAAIVSLRGCDLWSGPVDSATGLIVFTGSAEVRNDAGSVLIDKRNIGTLIPDRQTAPERPRGFSAAQLLRAVATVEMSLK